MAAIDTYAGWASVPEASYPNAINVTPSDTEDLPAVTTAIMVQNYDGTIRVQMLGGQIVTFTNLYFVTMRVTRIFATGTTATGIVAFW